MTYRIPGNFPFSTTQQSDSRSRRSSMEVNVDNDERQQGGQDSSTAAEQTGETEASKGRSN